MSKQFLVKRGGHFGQENWIIIILERLRLLRKPGVHGMPGFVGQRVKLGEHVFLVIHQDVRRRAITAGGECSAALAFGFVTVAPAAPQTLSQDVDIFDA